MPKKVVILWQKDLQTQAKNAELMTTKKGMEPTILDPRQTLMTSQPQQTWTNAKILISGWKWISNFVLMSKI